MEIYASASADEKCAPSVEPTRSQSTASFSGVVNTGDLFWQSTCLPSGVLLPRVMVFALLPACVQGEAHCFGHRPHPCAHGWGGRALVGLRASPRFYPPAYTCALSC